MVTFNAEQWRQIGRALFKAAGATESNTDRVTEALIDSSLVGHDSHGVIRIVQYIQAIEAGHLIPDVEPVVVSETASSAMVDGKWTFGQVSAGLCMKKSIEKAKQQGIAISGLVRAYHIGRLGEYSEMAQNAGVIGMVIAGGFGGVAGSKTPGVAPFGGAKGAFGTNPISMGLPAGEMPGAMMDFATSSVAGGKISLSKAKGIPLPPGCILDKNGNPSTNADDFYDGGTMMTFGAHKGYGLAVAMELLGQALTGGELEDEEKLGGEGVYTKTGCIFIAIDAGIFRPFADYASAADGFLKKVKAVPPAPGFDEVLLPGEPELKTRAKRKVEGIALPDSSWETLQKQAVKYGVNLGAILG